MVMVNQTSLNKVSLTNEMLARIYPETFHTRSGRANGVSEDWGVKDWVCNCPDCAQIRRQIWERTESAVRI